MAAASQPPPVRPRRVPRRLHDLLDVRLRVADALGTRRDGAVVGQPRRERRRGFPGGRAGGGPGPVLDPAGPRACRPGRPAGLGPVAAGAGPGAEPEPEPEDGAGAMTPGTS